MLSLAQIDAVVVAALPAGFDMAHLVAAANTTAATQQTMENRLTAVLGVEQLATRWRSSARCARRSTRAEAMTLCLGPGVLCTASRRKRINNNAHTDHHRPSITR
jgi:hypothetical protein